ncbi:MarR family winged helix-turn-helix transcriptional regulator [Marisediminicola senii]|uniref:MarR family winged helix-turn-helix transcriptional regulator n=1 Tax=Marisediminicola senii TaxID=2711233 RepID=UPI0013EA7DCC|nr:MarR family winged helix-turn-helix transcriptional regulator [Marisediminicola senii]
MTDELAVDSADDARNAVEEQLGQLARQVRASFKQAATAIDPALSPFGLKLMRLLARSGPTQASIAAEQLDVDRSVISRQARQLEELGLVETAVDPHDGRARFLSVTPVAVTRLEAVGATGTTLLHAALADWSVADLRQFAGYLERLSAGPAE